MREGKFWGGHACGLLFSFSKVTENAYNDKTIDFFHIFSDVAIGSENSPSLNCNIIDCYVILLKSGRTITSETITS